MESKINTTFSKGKLENSTERVASTKIHRVHVGLIFASSKAIEASSKHRYGSSAIPIIYSRYNVFNQQAKFWRVMPLYSNLLLKNKKLIFKTRILIRSINSDKENEIVWEIYDSERILLSVIFSSLKKKRYIFIGSNLIDFVKKTEIKRKFYASTLILHVRTKIP